MASSAKTGKGAATRDGSGGRLDRANGAEADLAPAQDARRIAAEMGYAMLLASSTETAKHCDDVVVLTRALCEQLELGGTAREDALVAARLHDIGKASIPQEILEKPGPLTASEWELMREHTVKGEAILSSITELGDIAKMVRHSHERWDGLGYPDGLVGEEIPLGSRIIFCADAFHAIRADRPYRRGRPAPQALAGVVAGAGTQFDPRVVEALGEVFTDLRLQRTAGRSARAGSGRLLALLLTLTLGCVGSAAAASDLLGEPAAPGGSTPAGQVTAAECAPACVCPATYGSSESGLAGTGAALAAPVADEPAPGAKRALAKGAVRRGERGSAAGKQKGGKKAQKAHGSGKGNGNVATPNSHAGSAGRPQGNAYGQANRGGRAQGADGGKAQGNGGKAKGNSRGSKARGTSRGKARDQGGSGGNSANAPRRNK
jgi:putative nucleotidyltransferase with HDIG domain